MNDEGARETAPLLFAQEGNPLTRIPFARTSLKASAVAAAALGITSPTERPSN